MASKQWALANLFGPSSDARFAELIKQLSEVVGKCSRHFIKSGGRDLDGIVDFEHRADAIVDAIHELLDNSFILRFDVLDSMKLTEDLDNVIDGMRKVAIHMDVYKLHLQELRPEAVELMRISDRMVQSLQRLVGMLGGPKLVLSRVREISRSVDEAETEADSLYQTWSDGSLRNIASRPPTRSDSSPGISSSICLKK